MLGAAPSPKASPNLIFDIGFNVGGDTHNYLAAGYRVIAVEASTSLVRNAFSRQPFKDAIAKGQLTLLNVGVGHDGSVNRTFWESEETNGERSSVDRWRCVGKPALGKRHRRCTSTTVPVRTCADFIQTYGPPLYIKIDIEGADSMCVDQIAHHIKRTKQAPIFLSAEELQLNSLMRLYGLGFSGFKCQSNLPYWEGGQFFNPAVGTSSGPFGDAVIDQYTNSSAWRSVRDYIDLHDKLRKPGDKRYTVTGRGRMKCRKGDLHLRHREWRRVD